MTTTLSPKPKRDWRLTRVQAVIETSPSQIENAEDCWRKWWFQTVRKLPTGPAKGSQVFGTVIHAVIDRYLSADELGRDSESLQPVDLYPPGWQIAKSRWAGKPADGEITPAEQDIAQKLIHAAIEHGVLVREKERRQEYEFLWPLLDGELCPKCEGQGGRTQFNELGNDFWEPCDCCGGIGKFAVKVKGFIDLITFDPASVQDHKSMKDFRYAKTTKTLEKNRQLLIYGKILIDELRAMGKPVPATIELRHNQYCKDPDNPKVRPVSAHVTPQRIADEWKAVEDIGRKMLKLRLTVVKGLDIENPPTGVQACNKYGGCPFIPICTGQESEAGYEMRLDKWQQNNKNNNAEATGGLVTTGVPSFFPSFRKDDPMSLKDIMAKRTGAVAAVNAGTPVVGVGAAPVQPTPVQQAAAPAAPVVQQPPITVTAQTGVTAQEIPLTQPAALSEGMVRPSWANPVCASCSGIGFNKTTGKPCRICASTCRSQNRPSPCDARGNATNADGTPAGDYKIDYEGGIAFWENLSNADDFGQSPISDGPAAQVTVQQPAIVQPPVQETPPVVTPPVITQPVVQQAPGVTTQQMAAPVANPIAARTAAAATVQAPAAPAAPIVGTVSEGTPPPTVDDAAAEADTGKGKGSRGRPAKGFTLLIGCAPIKGTERKGSGRFCYQLPDVLAEITAAAVEAFNDNPANASNKIESWHDLGGSQPFERWNILRKYAPDIAESFGADDVSLPKPNSGTDLAVLLEALLPLAGRVIVSY